MRYKDGWMRVTNRCSVVILFILIFPLGMPLSTASASSISIDAHPNSISADEAHQFTAIATDSSGNPVNDEINWSASSGLIDSNGYFTPKTTGDVTITASVGSINTTTNITVTKGWPFAIESNFQTLDVSVGEVVNLSANLVDRGGNYLDQEIVYRCQNGQIDFENKTWVPEYIGNTTMRIMYQEIEHQVIFNVQPGEPVRVDFPLGLTVQSGSTLHINLTAYDSKNNEVKSSELGQLSFEVENGSISNTGLYFATTPGYWNVSVNTSIGVVGFGKIRVLPAQATGLDIEIDSLEVRAGSKVNLSAIRTDIFGNSGQIDIPLANWTTPTGTLAKVDQTVQWTPSNIGEWVIGVSDQGFSSTITVSVTQGYADYIDISFSESIFQSGELIIASLSVFDSVGNSMVIDGAWEVSSAIDSVDHGSWQELRPGLVGDYPISATWFDNESQQVFEIEKIMNIVPGELARIILPESGTRIASDEVLLMRPSFEDEFGNELPEILVQWTIEDVDLTMEIRLAGHRWAPDKLGIHEIRANSQGIFAITEIEVIPGAARQIYSNFNETISIESGKKVEIQIFTLDVNGNQALANEVDFEFEDPSGIITTSPEGIGHWYIEGGVEGSWILRYSSGTAVSDLMINVTAGEPVRLIAEIPPEIPDEGDEMILRIYAIDQAGNVVDVPDTELTIKCSAGETEFISDDTYILYVEQSGQSHSCSVYWNDLVAQRFFDVNAVLFGGGLGSTNTALTMVSVIVVLFIAIMLVLIRRLRDEEEEIGYIDEDDLENTEDDLEPEEDSDITEEHVEESQEKTEESTEELRARLAAKAKKTGVMQAAPGTKQGKTGWYIDSSGELTSWLVSEDGEWTRIS